jgi:peptidoglycan/LPS O-acetylase OafA/YrhL
MRDDQQAGLAYRRDIDGLRALAVAAIVVHHAFPAVLPGGFIGVDVFFVISGFLITRILARGARRGPVLVGRVLSAPRAADRAGLCHW